MGAGRLPVAAAVLALIGWASGEAISSGLAEERLALVDRTLGRWARDLPPPRAEWDAAQAALSRVEAHQAGHPAMLELKGLLLLRRVDDPEAARRAHAHFAAALQRRPVSAVTWANLAEAKYVRDEIDDTFAKALEAAAALGPSNPHVQRMIAHYGLAVWDEIDDQARAAVDRAVGAGTQRNPLEMLQIAERRGRLPLACRHLEGSPRQPDPRWSRYCPSREATR